MTTLKRGLKLTFLTLSVLFHAIQARIRLHDQEQSKRKRLRVLKQMNQSQKNQAPKPTFLPIFAPTNPPSTNPSNSPSAFPKASLNIIPPFPTIQTINDASSPPSAAPAQVEPSSKTSSETSKPYMTPAINVLELVPFTVLVSSQSNLEEVTKSLKKSLLKGMRENMSNLLSIDLFVDKVEESRRRLKEHMKTVQYSGSALFEGSPLTSDEVFIETQIGVLGDSQVIEQAGVTELKIGNTIKTPTDSSISSPPNFSPKPPGLPAAVASSSDNSTESSGVLIAFVVVGSLLFIVLGSFVGYRYWKIRSSAVLDIQKSNSTNEMTKLEDEQAHEDETSQKLPNMECDDFSIDFSFDGESVVSSSVNSATREAATKHETAAYLRERALLQSQRQQLLYRNNDDSYDDDVEFSYDYVGEIASSDLSMTCATKTSTQLITDCIEVGEDGETSYQSNVDNSYLANLDNILDMSAELEQVESETPFDEMPFDEHVEKQVSNGSFGKADDSHDLKRKESRNLTSSEVQNVEKIGKALDSSPTKSPNASRLRVSRKQSRDSSRGEQEDEGLSSFLRERRRAKLVARMSETR